MNKTTLLSAGAWALGLLTGLFAWLSPDSALFPAPFTGFLLLALSLAVLVVGAFALGFRRNAPRASTAVHVAAIAPMLAAALALMLAARGLLPHPALPLVFIIAVGIGARSWAGRVAGAPMGSAAELAIAVAMIASLLVTIPALLLAAGGQVIWAVATPNFARGIARAKVTDVLVQYRPAPRVGITPQGAGLALQVISETGQERRDSMLMVVPGTSPERWLPDSGPFNGWSGDLAMRHAVRGLSKTERAWLGKLPAHPAISFIDTVAYAAALDPWAGLATPIPAHTNVFMLPVLHLGSVRSAARVQLYRAALAMADHHPSVADSLARLVIGLGLRIRDDSDLLIGTLIGSSIAREGGLTLAEIWRSTGKGKEADALVAALTYPPADTAATTTTPSAPRVYRARLIEAASTGTNGRAVLWEHLSILGVGACTDLRELLYGPTPAVRAAFTNSAPLFQRTPKERAVFDLMSLGITAGMGDAPAAPAFRPAAWALGRRPIAACAQTMFGGGV